MKVGILARIPTFFCYPCFYRCSLTLSVYSKELKGACTVRSHMLKNQEMGTADGNKTFAFSVKA